MLEAWSVSSDSDINFVEWSRDKSSKHILKFSLLKVIYYIFKNRFEKSKVRFIQDPKYASS